MREFRRRAERRGEPQRKLERYVGRRAEETLTIKDQVERFPILKDAPVEGKYTETIRVNFNPVGLWLRNVRCIRCGEWGHQSGDRECKLRDHNPNGEGVVGSERVRFRGQNVLMVGIILCGV